MKQFEVASRFFWGSSSQARADHSSQAPSSQLEWEHLRNAVAQKFRRAKEMVLGIMAEPSVVVNPQKLHCIPGSLCVLHGSTLSLISASHCLKNKPMCYPQQLGRFWHVFVPEPSTTSIAMCTGTFQNLIRYLPRNPPEPHQLSSPEPFGTSSAFCTGTLRNFISFLHQNPPEPCLLSTPEPSEPCLLYAPEPTGTRRNLISFLHGTLRNLISFLHRNPPPEPCLLSTPEPSGTSSAICTGTVRNLVCYLHPNPPEPSGTFSGTWGCSCTGSHQSYSGLKTP